MFWQNKKKKKKEKKKAALQLCEQKYSSSYFR